MHFCILRIELIKYFVHICFLREANRLGLSVPFNHVIQYPIYSLRSFILKIFMRASSISCRIESWVMVMVWLAPATAMISNPFPSVSIVYCNIRAWFLKPKLHQHWALTLISLSARLLEPIHSFLEQWHRVITFWIYPWGCFMYIGSSRLALMYVLSTTIWWSVQSFWTAIVHIAHREAR